MTGTGEPGATVMLTFPNGETVEAVVGANGNYAASSLTPQSDGDVIASQIDEAGNISESVNDDYTNLDIVFVEDEVTSEPAIETESSNEGERSSDIGAALSDNGEQKNEEKSTLKRYFQDFMRRVDNGFEREVGEPLRTGYTTESARIGDTTDGLIVQTVTFEHNINVQLTAELVQASNVKSWAVSLANGGSLPDWVEYVPGSDFFEMLRPLDQDEIKLRVRAILDNGRTVSKTVVIDLLTGVVEDEGVHLTKLKL